LSVYFVLRNRCVVLHATKVHRPHRSTSCFA